MVAVGTSVRLINASPYPQVLGKNEHFCQVVPLEPYSAEPTVCSIGSTTQKTPRPVSQYREVLLDPGNLMPHNTRREFKATLEQYSEVFSPNIPGYNGSMGAFKAVVNMGPTLPQQCKGRVPMYSRKKLVELQAKFDELEALGVFKRPDDIGIVAEYVNPSFLVKKPNGGYRLVTAFTSADSVSLNPHSYLMSTQHSGPLLAGNTSSPPTSQKHSTRYLWTSSL